MRISDCSSDVCSSDLKQLWRFHIVPGDPALGFENKAMDMAARTWSGEWWKNGGVGTANGVTVDARAVIVAAGVGAFGDRKSVGQGRSVSVRVAHVGRRLIKKKT